jgi:two-component system cell cycle response regulator
MPDTESMPQNRQSAEGDEQQEKAERVSDNAPTSGVDGLTQSFAHAINNRLAALIVNLDLVAEAMEGDPSGLAARLNDAREPLREARESAARIGEVVEQMQGTTSPAPRAEVRLTRPPPTTRSRQTRVMVVDDEAAIGRTLARALRGYEVVVFDNAREALERIVAGDRFDLVLCDLVMADMTGMDLYEEVVRLAPVQAQGFVFVTAGAVTTRARDFVRTVPNLVLAKPFDVQKIRDLVRDRGERSDRVVLVVDDDEATRQLIVRWLSSAKFSCIEHASGAAALQALVADPDAVDAVVLDVMMPGLDGFDVLAQLKKNSGTAHVPVVMLTAHAGGASDLARGLDAGASFYLTKPFLGPVLVAQVRAACERSDAERELRMRLHFAEAHATTDVLTGLMNRRAFEGRLAEAMANAGRHHEPLALVILDLDHFKRVNDTFGHGGGDRVLLYFARALRRAIRVGDLAFRYGGEEFALLLPKCDAEGALQVVSRIQRDLGSRPVSVVEGHPTLVRFSAGIASSEAANGFRIEELVIRADAALYTAKNGGRDRVELEA